MRQYHQGWFGKLLGRPLTRNQLIQHEIAATRDMFVTPDNHRFDFFYYGQVDEDTQEWIFHDWVKEGREWHVTTTRYLVEPDRVYRTREDQPYQLIDGDELYRFQRAVERYYSRVYSLYNP
jgi:hypothetical protein